MQSSALAFAPSAPLLRAKIRRSSAPPVGLYRPISFKSSPTFAAILHGPSPSSAPDPKSSLSSRFPSWISSPPLLSDGDSRDASVAAISESAGDTSKATNPMGQMLQLGALFGLWYLFNIFFNIYNKQVLKVFPFPVTITTFQFAVGTVLIFFMWTLNIYKKPKITSAQLLAILPLAFVHTLGNLFTNMSLGKVSVSFTHTIKAMEPFFSVILSAMFLGEMPSIWVVMSLMPIVGGVALASLTEASFNWAGFWSAMASNVTNQSRNVLSKKLLIKKEVPY